MCSSSDFFKTRLKPEWSREDAAHITLTHHEPNAFNLYVNWLYAHDTSTESAGAEDEDELHGEDWKTLAGAYVVGEEVLDSAFKDVVMDALRAKLVGKKGATIWTSMPQMIQLIYEGTPTNAPARRFLVDVYCFHATEGDIDELAFCGINDFFLDTMRAFARIRKGLAVTRFGGDNPSMCRCHGHDLAAGEVCYLEKAGA